MRQLVISCIVLYAVALTLNLSTSLPGSGLNGQDILSEYSDTQRVIASGWNILTSKIHSQNNTSIVIGLIIPALSKLLSTIQVFKIVLPSIFSLTPVLLFLAYRKVLSDRVAFIGALFFAILPPTWQEVPTIGKSTIAEPLAAGTLLVLFSRLDKKIWIPLVAGLTILTALAHYTVGFMLLGWLGCMAVADSISKRKVSYIFPVVGIATMVIALWFKLASDGIIMYRLSHAGVTDFDPLVKRLAGLTWASEINWVRLQMIALYIAVVIMGLGCYYIFRHYEQIDKRLIAGISVAGVLVLVRVFLTEYTGPLLLTRWVQYGAICLSPLFALGIEQIWVWSKRRHEQAIS